MCLALDYKFLQIRGSGLGTWENQNCMFPVIEMNFRSFVTTLLFKKSHQKAISLDLSPIYRLEQVEERDGSLNQIWIWSDSRFFSAVRLLVVFYGLTWWRRLCLSYARKNSADLQRPPKKNQKWALFVIIVFLGAKSDPNSKLEVWTEPTNQPHGPRN